jgi:signal transduction histidine kinase
MTSFLGVPIRLRDRVFGNLYLTDKLTAAEFSALDEELAVGLAGAAAVAIEHARLYTQVQDLTLTADRDRIARDLHDTVIQRLFATGLALQATSRLVRADPDAARDRIERAVDELDGTVRQIRTAIFGLGSASPTVGAGLRERVLTVASDAARPLGFHPAVTFEGVIDANVDDTLAREVLATLREALTNVARHAHAGRCAIVVRVHDQELTLEVIDDGVGPGRRDGAGRGLRNLAVRAEQRHGRFELVPGPDGGTAARWTVPLAPRAR